MQVFYFMYLIAKTFSFEFFLLYKEKHALKLKIILKKFNFYFLNKV